MPKVQPGWRRRRGRLRMLVGLVIAPLLLLGVLGQAAQASTAAPTPAPAPHATSTKPVSGTGATAVKAVCSGPAKPRYAQCMSEVRTGLPVRSGVRPTTSQPMGYTPTDLLKAYDLPADGGDAATVAIVDAYDDPGAEADLAIYRQQYGLPACTAANGCFRKVDQRGGTSYPQPDAGWAEEISLDLDMVSAICPKCRILLVEADSNSLDDLGAAVNEAVALGARYVSNSYSGPEYSGETALLSQYYEHPGVVITAATGDTGASNSSAPIPAADPDVTAVGGTTLTRDTGVARGWTESAWAGGGSGCSEYIAKPSWQTDTGCASRVTADVSAVADPATGVAVYDSYGGANGWNVIGGTSAATPVIAAVYALAGLPAPGSDPASYPYAHPADLNDVTTGRNGDCEQPILYVCKAGPGYDGPTGLGTPDGAGAFASGPHGELSGRVVSASGHAPVAGATVTAGGFQVTTGKQGNFAFDLPVGGYQVTASAYGYTDAPASGVTVTAGATTTDDVSLRPDPYVMVSGTVTDGSGQGWPLAATVTVPGTPVAAATDPVTGRYSLRLPSLHAYPLRVTSPGYQPDQQAVSLGSGGATSNVTLDVDTTSCTAPGYAFAGSTQTFDTRTTPPGWTVTDAAGTGQTWSFDNPAGRPNQTGGAGNDAIIDSAYYYYASGTGAEDTSLVSPVIDMSGYKDPVITWANDLDLGSGATAEVDVSTDGGQTWTSVWSTSGSFPKPLPYTGPDALTVPIPQAAGQGQVRVRFRWSAAQPRPVWWAVDNVFIGDHTCAPQAGGLVTGTVTDENTGHPVSGATVAGSAASPASPASAASATAGNYVLFAPAGSQTLTASRPYYATATRRLTVTAGQVIQENIALPAGRLAVSPASVTASAVLGGAARTKTITITNTGTAPASLSLDGQPAGTGRTVTPASAAPRSTGHGAPVERIKGTYSPLSLMSAAGHSSAVASASGASAADTSLWTRIADPPAALEASAAATDPSTGIVYDAGGYLYNGYRNGGWYNGPIEPSTSAYAYDPSTGQWTDLPDLQVARESAQAAFLGGKFIVTGGFGGTTETEIYDPRTGAWSRGAPVPIAYGGAGTAVLDGRLYVIGGCDTDCGHTDVQVYDPVSNSWSTAASYPEPISWASCGAISGKIYCAGGVTSNSGTDTEDGYSYNPVTNTWSSIPKMPMQLWGGAVSAADGELLISGGITGGNTVATNVGYAYNPSAGAWTSLPDAPVPDYRGASACGMYSIGGITPTGENALFVPFVLAEAWQLPGYGDCDSSGASWLSLSSVKTATLSPGQRVTVTVTVNPADSSITQPGIVTGGMTVNQDTPYDVTQADVTLKVTPPSGWGEVTGTVTGLGCAGPAGPLQGATVQIEPSGGKPQTVLGTSADGAYKFWLDSGGSPLRLLVSDDDWQPQTRQVTIRAGQATTASFPLKSDFECSGSDGPPAAGSPSGGGSPAGESVERLCPAATTPGTVSCYAEKLTGNASASSANARAKPDGTFNDAYGYEPSDLLSAYDLSADGGQGAVIGIVDAYDDPNAEADLAKYRAEFGLSACTTANGCFRKVDQRGGTDYPEPDAGWAAEISLDLDMVSAIAPEAHIVLVEADSSSVTDLGAAVDEAVAQGATYVSNSYGGPEDPSETTWDKYYDHPGVVVTAASGDDGYGVSYPAASPNVTAVGGTKLVRHGNGWQQTVWDGTVTDEDAGAPGSGCSAYEPKPAWQADTGCAHRTVTDVSAVADPLTGVAVYDSYGVADGYPDWGEYGGTSVASPIIASVYALAGAAGGTASPASYPYGAPSALSDVTSGNNGRCAPAYLCTAGPGYDGPTGLGSPDGLAAFTKPADRGTITGTVRNSATGDPVAGASVTIGAQTVTTGSGGSYTLVVPAGSYTVAAADYLYTSANQDVTVSGGATVTRDVSLDPVPTATISGRVTDGSGHGWPLAATVQVENSPLPPVTTDPLTGEYSVTVPANASYTLGVSDDDYAYDQVSQQVSVETGAVSQDFALTQDGCTAAGYGYSPVGLSAQTFDAASVPSGWTVTDNAGTGQTWRFDDPGALNNRTGGSGNFAVVDSGYYGVDGKQDTSLTTPAFSLASVSDPAISFATAYLGESAAQTGEDTVFDVDLSLDGGATWSNVWEQTGETGASYDTISVPIPQAAGASDVKVRLHYTAQGYDPYETGDSEFWEVDNVFVGSGTCATLPGGLVTGTVLDANTGQPANGVTISAASGSTTTGSRGNPSGTFTLFVPAGTQRLSLSGAGYQAASEDVTVADDAVTGTTVSLAAGDVTAPASLGSSVTLGAKATTSLTLSNTGGAPATVTLGGLGGQSTSPDASAARPSAAPAGGAPKVVKGHFRTGKPALRAGAVSVKPSKSATPQAAPADAGSSGSTWTSLPEYPDNIADNGVAAAPDGTVYSAGGITGLGEGAETIVSDAYAYSPADGQWKRIAPLPDPVYQPSTAFTDGRLYVIGGIGDDNPLATVQVYDPASNTWSAGTSMPAGRWAAGTAVLNGKIYVIGGCASAACPAGAATVYAYDPATGGWTSFAGYPLPAAYLGCGGISGRVYCAGGYDTSVNNGTAATYSFSPKTNSWTSEASLPASVWGAATAASGGDLVVSGGVIANGTEITSQTYGYDPASNTWSPLPTLSQALYRGGATCGFNVVGGYGEFSAGTVPSRTFDQLSGEGQCSAGVPWLAASSTTVTVPAHGSVQVPVTLNAGAAGVTQPGTYIAQLSIGTDTPYQVTPVTVTMNVTPPVGWAQVTGTVSAQDCSGASSALPAATVQINARSAGYTLTTDADGRYSLWLDARSSPLVLLVSKNGYLAQARTVSLSAGQTATDNITLQPLSVPE